MTGASLNEVEGSAWDDLLDRLGVSDLYYRRGFVEASAALVASRPVLLHLSGAGGDVVFPCLVRADPVDVVTSYGYGGPLPLGADPPVAEFADAYVAWCARRGVVSSFVVHHPLFATQRVPMRGFRVQPLAGTVAWPLDEPDLLGVMHKHHRRQVRRAEGAGLVATVRAPPEDLSEFVALYDDAMVRLGAADFHRFNDDYWQALAAAVTLVQVVVRGGDGEAVAAVLGAGEPPWLHYHLGAAAQAGRGTGASHLALYTLARWGRDHGYAQLHLGGGVGGRDDDLLVYKQRFAPGEPLASCIGKAVHDLPAYTALAGPPSADYEGFFPAYRRSY
ncbi:MAG: GNAT family N-acetyltransferase [Solirubrobacteraceae bacterium]